jgi:ABC-type multidrug transport system ATPase subunit
MGTSGSGKTTLLSCLAQRGNQPATVPCTVLADGNRLSPAAIRTISAYVKQEDSLIGSLTVRETVDFAARLSKGSSHKTERLGRVDALLQSFGLTEQAQTLVGTPLRRGVSGEQKRRTSIAAQIITDPKILFLDKPTSGLDSTASYEIIGYLKGDRQTTTCLS